MPAVLVTAAARVPVVMSVFMTAFAVRVFVFVMTAFAVRMFVLVLMRMFVLVLMRMFVFVMMFAGADVFVML